MFNEKFSKKLLCTALCVIVSPLINASEDSDTNKEIEQLLVSATRFEGPALPSPSNISVITADDIRLTGASVISDVLRTQAGIQIQDLDGSGGRSVTFAMRGFSGTAANNVLVLVDGRKLNNPTLAGPNLNAIALKNVERIEVIKGSAGVLYGDQAVAGVINVITKKATRGELSGNVEVLHGSDDLVSYRAQLSQGFDNGLSYRLSGENKTADNYRDNNEARYHNTLLNVRYDFERGNVFVESQSINDNLRLPGSISEVQVEQDARQTNVPIDFSDKQLELFRTGGEFELGENWKLLAEYARRDEDGQYVLWGGSLTHQSMTLENMSPRLVGSIPVEGGTAMVTLGYDRVRAEYKSDNAWSPADSEQAIDAYYGQLLYPLSSSLTLSGGMRVSRIKDDNDLANLENTDQIEAYELGASWQLNNDLRLFFRQADAFRFGNIDENAALVFGSTSLKPQRSVSNEVGFEWQLNRANIKATFFDMDIDDEIMYDGILWANLNVPKSNRKGLSVEADYQITSTLSLMANYTRMSTEVEAGSYEGKEVPFVSENEASLAISYEPIQNLNFYVDANYTGSRFMVNDETNGMPKLDSETIVNANISWSWEQWRTHVRVKNLTQEKYSNYHATWGLYPQPRRTVEASVSYSF